MTVDHVPRRRARGHDHDAEPATLPIPLPRTPQSPLSLAHPVTTSSHDAWAPPPAPPARPRHRWLGLLLVLVLLLIAGVAAWFMLRPSAAAPGNAAATSAGPGLVDQDGQSLPPELGALVTGVYDALEAGDLPSLQKAYSNLSPSWVVEAPLIQTPTQRAPLLAALRNPPRHTDGDYTYGITADGSLSFVPGPDRPWVLGHFTVPIRPAGAHPSSTTTGPSCPPAATLVQEFARKTVYGTGARAIGPVTCAAGFAVVRIKGANTPDGVSTIYSLGPPTRYLAMGTGPICSDNPADGDVLVPHSAASKLNCITSPAAPEGSDPNGAATNLAGYAGEWDAHGVGVTFNNTGRAEVSFRTYNWCNGTGSWIPCRPLRAVRNPRGEPRRREGHGPARVDSVRP